MRKNLVATIALLLCRSAFIGATSETPAPVKSPYPRMAPLDRYLIAAFQQKAYAEIDALGRPVHNDHLIRRASHRPRSPPLFR